VEPIDAAGVGVGDRAAIEQSQAALGRQHQRGNGHQARRQKEQVEAPNRWHTGLQTHK
jgi:hypothetical protein